MKYLFIVLLATISLNGASQIQEQQPEKSIKIGEVKSGLYVIAELSFIANDDTLYTILYNNAEYKTIHDFQALVFGGGQSVLNELYNILASFFTEDNKKNKDYMKQFKLGDTDVAVYNVRVMGVSSIRVYTNNGFFYLTEKQLNKLFGK